MHLSVASKQRDGVASGRALVVFVTDTGIGIAAGAQERVFEPFKQADASTTREFGGTGLGLCVAFQSIDTSNTFPSLPAGRSHDVWRAPWAAT